MSSLSFNKTRLGFDPFDRAFGGIFFHRPTLIWGPRNSGKSLLSAQFAAKVLHTGERVCVMADGNPDNFFLDLQSFQIDIGSVVASGQLRTLSCRAIAASSPDGLLPFDSAIEELRSLCVGSNTPFFIFNTVIPWVAVPPDHVEARVDAFLAVLGELGITSLLLLPRPVSPAANHLRDVLAERCPVVLQTLVEGSDRHIRVASYRGATDVTLPADYAVAIVPGRGFVLFEDSEHSESSSASLPSAEHPRHHRPHHRALLSVGGPPSTPVPVKSASGVPVAHPRHDGHHHHSLLDPTTIGSSAADSAPPPAADSAPPPAATPAPPPAATPAPPPAAASAPPPATAPTPSPAADAAPRPRRHRFSSVIQ